MKRPTALFGAMALILVPGLIAAPVPKDDKEEVKKELAKLEGTWRIVSHEKDGEKLDVSNLPFALEVTFKGKDFSFANNLGAGSIENIDPTKKPKTIDYKVISGANDGKTELSIYELDGDTFRDCIAPPGKDRPTKFTAAEGTGQTLIVYERVKKK